MPDEPGLPCSLFVNHDHLIADDDDPNDNGLTFAESDPRAKEGYLKTQIDQDRLLEFEQKAQIDSMGFFGTYHVCIG